MIISRVECFCEKYNYEKAILVFDVINPGEDFVVAKCITNFLFMSKLGKGFNHILEMPFFVNSEVTPAIQIADIFAGIIRHYYENGLDLLTQDKIADPFELWVNNLFLQINSKTENYRRDSSGFVDYGFYKIGKKF